MSESNSSSSSNGIGFTRLLTIVFIVLKLMNVIDWSWWWVVSPILFEIAIVITILFVLGVIALVAQLLDK
jgi:hypothetical protein